MHNPDPVSMIVPVTDCFIPAGNSQRPVSFPQALFKYFVVQGPGIPTLLSSYDADVFYRSCNTRVSLFIKKRKSRVASLIHPNRYFSR